MSTNKIKYMSRSQFHNLYVLSLVFWESFFQSKSTCVVCKSTVHILMNDDVFFKIKKAYSKQQGVLVVTFICV